MYRTVQQQREILFEAERRVRAGERHVDVARALGIPPSTVADWARRDGWRRKDLIAVRNVERGEMILGLINQVVAEERAKSEADAAKMREALEASKAELEAIVPDGMLCAAMSAGPVPAHKLAMAMADSLLRQGELEESDRALRLAGRFAEVEQAAAAREETKWREERERLTKLWAEKQTAYHKLHALADFTLKEVTTSAELGASRSAQKCCPKCGRRMDFWPEEVERPDDDPEDDEESGSGEFGAGEPGSVEFRAAESAESGSGEFRGGESGEGELLLPRWPGD